MTGRKRASLLAGVFLVCSAIEPQRARAQSPGPEGSDPAPAQGPPSARPDADAWYRGAAEEEEVQARQAERDAAQADAREEEERRKWVVGLAGGYGVASGSKQFRADYVAASLMVSRHSLSLDSPSNAFLTMEVPVRRYVTEGLNETAWGTGLYVFGGIQEWWVAASAGLGGGLVPGTDHAGPGARARLGIRVWRFVLGGEAGGICGSSGQGGIVCIGDAGGLLSLDMVRMFASR